jgi:hypothetical protein
VESESESIREELKHIVLSSAPNSEDIRASQRDAMEKTTAFKR